MGVYPEKTALTRKDGTFNDALALAINSPTKRVSQNLPCIGC
jgi:hypothetical protein